MTALEAIEIAALGAIAGGVGGLAGIGGSIIMLPGLHFVLRPEDPQAHHLFMATAMVVNMFVAVPSALSHHRERAVRTELLVRLSASSIAGVVAGVLVSNLVWGGVLKALLAVVLLLYAARNLQLIARPRRRAFDGSGRVERVTTPKLLAIGAGVGLFGGMLGLGGGVLLMPLLQVVCNLKLRQAIATSSAVISISAVFGAGLKLLSLGSIGLSPADALTLAAVLAPGAIVGGWFGAKLTHRLPRSAVRLALVVLLAAIASRMLGVWGDRPAPAPTPTEVVGQ